MKLVLPQQPDNLKCPMVTRVASLRNTTVPCGRCLSRGRYFRDRADVVKLMVNGGGR